tara:strand:- start:346 stop:540 length:195 start_codon:yes stop_codon:yes gene_type:complete
VSGHAHKVIRYHLLGAAEVIGGCDSHREMNVVVIHHDAAVTEGKLDAGFVVRALDGYLVAEVAA